MIFMLIHPDGRRILVAGTDHVQAAQTVATKEYKDPQWQHSTALVFQDERSPLVLPLLEAPPERIEEDPVNDEPDTSRKPRRKSTKS